MTQQQETILQVSDLQVYYGAIHAIKGVSFEVKRDEIVTLIGGDGAGKSTTLNTVAGLLKPRSGSITFRGENVTGTPASKMVYKGLALCPEGGGSSRTCPSGRTWKWAAFPGIRRRSGR